MKSTKNTFRKDGKALVAFIITALLIVTIIPAMTPGDDTARRISSGGQMSTPSTVTYTVTFDEPSFQEITLMGHTFTQLKHYGTLSTGDELGTPTYLVHPVQLLLPLGTEVSGIDVTGVLTEIDVSTRYDLQNKPVPPYQPMQPIGGNQDQLIIDYESYNSTDMVPGESYYSYGVDYCRGYPILTLNLYPFQYIPGEAQLFYYPDLTIEVTLEETGELNQFYRGSPEDLAYVNSLVANPGEASLLNGVTLDYPGGICTPAGHYDYVIITRSALADFTATYNWTDLIAQRQSEGMTATIVTTEAITAHPDYYNMTPFNDSQARIREFCRDAYSDWETQYILIAGDHEGTSAIPRRLMKTNYEGSIESDLYWSNLDNSFNADGDSDWGEEGDNGFDLYGELFIGGIPCDTTTDISNWLQKTLYYTANYEKDYLENMAFYGGDTGWDCQGDDFIDFTFYGTNNWLGPNPNADGPWPGFLGFLYGFDTWNSTHPGSEWNNSVRWTAEPPNPGWQGGSETGAIAGLKTAINNNHVTQIYGIAHANSDMSLDVYSSSWESQYTNTRPFFIHDYGCHCGDMSASDDGVLHSMLFHSPTELAFACVFNTCYGWGNLVSTNSSSALQQKLFVDYMFNESKSGGAMNWQLGRVQGYTKDAMAPTILWDYSYGTFRAIIQGCLLFGDPALTLKPPLLPQHNIAIQSLDVPSHVIPNEQIRVNATLLNNGLNNETNVRVSFRVNGTELSYQTIPFFTTYTTQQVSFTWTPAMGWYTVAINVTVPGVVENITTDNERSQVVVAGADVAVTSITVPTYAAVESLTPVQAEVVNYGAQDEYVDISLTVNSVAQDTISIFIRAGSSQTVTLLWNPTSEGVLAVTIEADVPLDIFTANNAKTAVCSVLVAKGFVLLVDDDTGGDTYETYYQTALMASGYLYQYWNRGTQGCPPVATMSQYSAVVWFTGDDSSTTLETADITALTSYLNGGGRLFISGQDIGYDINTNSFYANYLHATYGVDDTNIVDLNGIAGDPIGNGLSLVISTGDGANNQAWPSGIYAVSPATAVFQYLASPYYAAVKTDTGTYRVVYFAFGFEAINTAWDRATVMNRTITWLTTGGGVSPTLPDLTFTPLNLDYLAAPGSTIIDTLTIGNRVGATGNLTYQFTSLPSSVSITPTSGTLTPGATQPLSLHINTSTITGNFTHFFLTLTTNDPDESQVKFPVYISLGFNQVTLTLSQGWNLITVPVDTDWTAEDLGQQISGCTVVLMFNASTQTFVTHVVGTPWDDFPILDGVGYFVYVTGASSFATMGRSLTSASVPIYAGWNMIGWFHSYTTTAAAVSAAIPGTSVISMFNATTQQFVSHVTASSWDNFIVTPGMGLFLYTTQASTWDGDI